MMSENELNEFGLPSESKDKFSTRRMFTMTRRVLRQLVRDKRTFGMILIMPILIMIIFGYALSGEVNNVPIIVINEDQAFNFIFSPTPSLNLTLTMNAGQNITDALDLDKRVAIDTSHTSWDDSIQLVEDGEFSAVILIPRDFSENIVSKLENPLFDVSLSIYLDGTKPTIKGSVMAALQEALQDSLGEQAVELDTTLAFGNAEFSGLDTAVPAVMALVLTFLVLLISLVTIIREQLYGTLSRIYSTPLTKTERLLGFVLALTMVGMLMVLSVITIGTLGFGAEVSGNFVVLLLSAFLYAIVHVFLAVFLSNFAENELQAIQFAPLIAFPSMALSGMLVPTNSLPGAAESISNFVPMTYGIKIFEGIMLKGFGIEQLWLDYLILTIFAFVAFALASLTIKDKLE
jgi:ABC-2 type transport system permease protein